MKSYSTKTCHRACWQRHSERHAGARLLRRVLTLAYLATTCVHCVRIALQGLAMLCKHVSNDSTHISRVLGNCMRLSAAVAAVPHEHKSWHLQCCLKFAQASAMVLRSMCPRRAVARCAIAHSVELCCLRGQLVLHCELAGSWHALCAHVRHCR